MKGKTGLERSEPFEIESRAARKGMGGIVGSSSDTALPRTNRDASFAEYATGTDI